MEFATCLMHIGHFERSRMLPRTYMHGIFHFVQNDRLWIINEFGDNNSDDSASSADKSLSLVTSYPSLYR